MVKHVEQLELSLLDLADGDILNLLLDVSRGDENADGVRHLSSKNGHVGLVINQLALLTAALDRGELTTARSVAHSNDQGPHKREASAENDHHACLHHDLVDQARVALQLEGAVFFDVDEAAQHVYSWNSFVSESEPSVVHGLIADLVSHVTALDTVQLRVVFRTSDLDHKWLDSVVVFPNDAASEHESMRRMLTESARPRLGRLLVGSVDHKLVGFKVESGRGLKASHVGAMTQLGLCVAADNREFVSHWQPFILLLFGAKELDRVREHGLMHMNGRDALEHVTPGEHSTDRLGVVEEDLGCNSLEVVVAFPPALHLLLTCHFVVIERTLHLGVFPVDLGNLVGLLLNFGSNQEQLELILVKGELLSLFDQVRVHDIMLDTATERGVPRLIHLFKALVCFHSKFL